MARMKVISGGATCKCTPGGYAWLVIGVIVMALGLWSVLKGVQAQWEMRSMFDWWVITWYAVGLLVLWIGKTLKCKGCGSCPMHG